jgi:hypothetical protein
LEKEKNIAALIFKEVDGVFHCEVSAEYDCPMVEVAITCAKVFDDFLDRHGIDKLEDFEGDKELLNVTTEGNA